ncbi:Calcineurin-binding protein cabin-1, partial [Armadillidium nasatum]
MSNVLLKAFSNLKTTQEINSYIEDLFESNKLPSWTVEIIPILQNWVTKMEMYYVQFLFLGSCRDIYLNMQASDIPEILNIYMKLNNLVDITTKWEIPDNLLKIAFWESVNELHM